MDFESCATTSLTTKSCSCSIYAVFSLDRRQNNQVQIQQTEGKSKWQLYALLNCGI